MSEEFSKFIASLKEWDCIYCRSEDIRYDADANGIYKECNACKKTKYI